MPYCPRCGEDEAYELDQCGCTVCDNCASPREVMDQLCLACRPDWGKVKPLPVDLRVEGKGLDDGLLEAYLFGLPLAPTPFQCDAYVS